MDSERELRQMRDDDVRTANEEAARSNREYAAEEGIECAECGHIATEMEADCSCCAAALHP